MRIAVCGNSSDDTQCLCGWIRRYCAARRLEAELYPFQSSGAFWGAFAPGFYHGAFVGFGDAEGFLTARRLREQDHGCRIVLIDDTQRYAIQGFRLHISDFILRPVGAGQIARGMDRILESG